MSVDPLALKQRAEELLDAMEPDDREPADRERAAIDQAQAELRARTRVNGHGPRQHQDEDQDQDQDQEQQQRFSHGEALRRDSAFSSATCHPGPGPGVVSEPNLLELALAEYKAGNLELIEVELGPMPERAGPRMVAVAEHMRFLIGLRLAVGEPRPLPYATSVPVAAGLVPDKGAASRVIRQLVAFGVIAHVGGLPRLRPGGDGTKLYAPPGGMP